MKKHETEFTTLMRELREGSEDAAWRIVEQYGEPIRRAVRRALQSRLRSKFDTLDFVQIVWSSLFRVRGKTSCFDKPEQLRAYLVAMARNKVAMELRRRTAIQKYDVRQERSLNELQERGRDVPSRDPMPIDVAIAREKLGKLLDSQPQRYRQIVSLRLQGLSSQSIADTLDVNKRTVERFFQKLFCTDSA